MTANEHTWAIVLAGGEGSRLRSLTTVPSGIIIPKQFCSLRDGPSLLQEALSRAQAVASDQFTCVVVAAQHRRWWESILAAMPSSNVIVQPEGRGTAIGILLPLLHIIARDPKARVVLMPSDHHVQDEAVLASALRRATQLLCRGRDETILLGLEPDECDPDLGYIVPHRDLGRGACEVAHFVEKPSLAEAEELIERGALWNAFIVVSFASALLELFRRRMSDLIRALWTVQSDLRAGGGSESIAQLYQRLPNVDFSRDILQGQEEQLRVLPVPRCGWCDLGTPARVERTLRRIAPSHRPPDFQVLVTHLNLAAQHERLQRA